MKRREFLLGAGALLALPGWAQTPTPGVPVSPSGVVIVELINFHCPRCRQVNDHLDRIRRAAQTQQMSFRVAPLAWDGQSLWPDRIYYAVRDLYPTAEALIRDAFFDGVQREGLQFAEMAQVFAFFERRQLPQQALKLGSFDLRTIAERAADDNMLLSEVKAGRLADLSGASEVPAFVWVYEGEVIRTVSPSDAAEPTALVQKVIRAINEPLRKSV